VLYSSATAAKTRPLRDVNANSGIVFSPIIANPLAILMKLSENKPIILTLKILCEQLSMWSTVSRWHWAYW